MKIKADPCSELMKRRKSNLANSEKLLQGMNATSSGARLMQRKGSVHACATILEFADEVNEENRGENRESTQSVEGGRRQECGNESYGLKKPEDPNQALLRYFAKLSSSTLHCQRSSWRSPEK